MKIAIIGANGFIGSRLVEALYLGDSAAVVPISRRPAAVALAARFTLDLRIADALDEAALATALGGCASAIHVARADLPDLKRMATTFCRAAAKAGVRRLVYVSSAAVHGTNPPAGTTEKSRPVEELDPAAAAHAAAERQFFAECKRASLAGFALRPGVVYGPRSPLIAALVSELQAERAWVLGTGAGICPSLYVDNLVQAVRLCLRTKTGAGEPYLLGDAETTTWLEFLSAIARELDLPTRWIARVDAPPSPADAARAAWQRAESKLGYAAASRLLGYAPTVTLAEGLRRTCAWWRFAQGTQFAAA